MLSKEEIEKAKEDLMFFNEGDYITREMDKSADVLEEYIEQLEQNNKKQNKMIYEITILLEELKICYFKKENGGELLGKYRCYNKKDWKLYFEKKVEAENELEN